MPGSSPGLRSLAVVHFGFTFRQRLLHVCEGGGSKLEIPFNPSASIPFCDGFVTGMDDKGCHSASFNALPLAADRSKWG